EKEGFKVCEAADGEEALVQISERKPDVVLLDWMLPLVSGIEVCRRLRRTPETRALPVIMLTARGEEGDRVRGLDSGADDYVVKPFSPSELVARLRDRSSRTLAATRPCITAGYRLRTSTARRNRPPSPVRYRKYVSIDPLPLTSSAPRGSKRNASPNARRVEAETWMWPGTP